jgi:hypothetical protein
MTMRVFLSAILVILTGMATYAEALVLCANSSGSVFALDSCKGA